MSPTWLLLIAVLVGCGASTVPAPIVPTPTAPAPIVPTPTAPDPHAPRATLRGVVTDVGTGEKIAGAVLVARAPSGGWTAMSDGLGQYELASIPAGEHEVVLHYLGVEVVRRIRIQPDVVARLDFAIDLGMGGGETLIISPE